jgi:hypothetical protein
MNDDIDQLLRSSDSNRQKSCRRLTRAQKRNRRPSPKSLPCAAGGILGRHRLWNIAESLRVFHPGMHLPASRDAIPILFLGSDSDLRGGFSQAMVSIGAALVTSARRQPRCARVRQRALRLAMASRGEPRLCLAFLQTVQAGRIMIDPARLTLARRGSRRQPALIVLIALRAALAASKSVRLSTTMMRDDGFSAFFPANLGLAITERNTLTELD